ncbi:hypothetical protein HDV06_003249 [Boothiomyces sp. JEL0866]|nr:hypothetical protein HDV06_003249 [Boothiomyces sp. JEL0866]
MEISNEAVITKFPDAVKEAIKSYFHSTFTASVNKIGLNSDVYILSPSQTNSDSHKASTQQKLVLKAPNSDYSRNAIKREIHHLQEIAKVHPKDSFRVPTILSIHDDWSLMNFVPGVNGADVFNEKSATIEQRIKICHAMGKALREIHTLKPNMAALRTAGLEMPTNSRSWLQNHLEHIRVLIESKLATMSAPPMSDKKREDYEEVAQLWKHAQKILKDDSLWDGQNNELVFVHGDAMLPNFLFDPISLQVQSVVDFGDSGYGDKRYDLTASFWSISYNTVRTLGESEEQAILYQKALLEGYGQSAPSCDNLEAFTMCLYELYDVVAYDL